MICHDPSMTAAGPARKTGPVYPLFALYLPATWSCALGICVYKWRRARGQERLRLQYLVAGAALSGAGGITSNLLLPLITGRSIYSWIGPYFVLVFIALVAHAIIRHR